MERFYLTTPIYYVNSRPHIGHAYTTIAADILARHHRQRGDEVFFLTGTDEHGTKVAQAAASEGLAPEVFVDRNAERFRDLARRVGASNDFFIRTTDEEHKRAVRDFLQRIHDNGHIYEGTYAGLYCTACEAFYGDAELVDGRCPQHGTEPEWVEEKNYFFRLSAFADRVLALYDADPDYVLPRFRANEARSFIERGLEDVSVSRGHQTWGIPVPWDESQVIYVWIDALINYFSALSYAPGDDLGRFWPARHLLAKDILKFHCVIWPAMLLAAGYDPPRQLFVHGYLLFDDRKMSKSLGNVIDPLDLIDVYGVDPLRFYLMRAATFGQDGNVSIDGVHERYERELGNDLGNLLSRTTAMIARYRGGALPKVDSDLGQTEAIRQAGASLHAIIALLETSVRAQLDRFELTAALDDVWNAVRALNRFVEETAPWTIAKDPSREADLDAVLYTLADGLRAVAVVLWAFLPATSEAILAALAQPVEVEWPRAAPGLLDAVAGIEPAPPLFPRVEAAAADAG